MSLTLPDSLVASGSDEPLYRLSVAQYHQMIKAGVLTPDDKLELLEGLLIRKMSKNPPHPATQAKLVRAIGPLLPASMALRMQDPITLDDGEPEPDLAVVRASGDDYASHHPYAADVLLVIEIADTTLRRDRGTKLRSYARAGIGQYWIVNLPDRIIEVYREPRVATGVYGSIERFGAGDSVSVSVVGIESMLLVKDLLPGS